MTISINIITTSMFPPLPSSLRCNLPLKFKFYMWCSNCRRLGLIIIRIWMVERQNKKFRAQPQSFTSGSGSAHGHQPPSALSLAMRNIIESGMIYTIASILQLALQRSNILFIVSALVS
jgi:hypothetical protein